MFQNVGHARPGELFENARLAGLSHPAGGGGIEPEFPGCFDHFADAFRRDAVAGFAVFDHLRRPVEPVADGRDSGRQRLHDRARQPLPQRKMPEQVGLRQKAVDLRRRNQPGEMEVRG
ncbi:hypothetical protein SDC9_114563 [bioreactor metagenome]|uniref:Uncharacterized protein n=1 Tax=bioreactor metagenome TaxID=1076179 RepID=A0A645BQD5_9ZZZZ